MEGPDIHHFVGVENNNQNEDTKFCKNIPNRKVDHLLM